MSENLLSLFPAVKPDFDVASAAGAAVNCGVILTPDGSFRIFQSGSVDDGSDITQGKASQSAMERKCLALAVALSNEQLMAILYDVIDNTDILSLLHAEPQVV